MPGSPSRERVQSAAGTGDKRRPADWGDRPDAAQPRHTGRDHRGPAASVATRRPSGAAPKPTCRSSRARRARRARGAGATTARGRRLRSPGRQRRPPQSGQCRPRRGREPQVCEPLPPVPGPRLHGPSGDPEGTGSDIGHARAPRSGRASQQPRLLNDSAGTGMSCVRDRKRRQCECGIGRAIPRRPGPQGPSHQEFTALPTVARNPGTVLAPDVAFVRRERIPASGPPAAFWEGAPGFGGGGHVARRYPAPRRRRVRGCGSWPARAWSGSWNPRRGADGAPRLPAFCFPVADIFA